MDYYAYLEDETLVDEHQVGLILREAWEYSKLFAGKGESDLNAISARVNSREAWEARARLIRAGILVATGLAPLPPPADRPPLHPVRHSFRAHVDEAGTGYSVENVILEILPGLYATGNLYRPVPAPTAAAPQPGVLLPHGHGQEGRFAAHYVNLAATLARLGCTCVTYDMQGYNEADQLVHRTPHVGAFQCWQSMRVLDFLLGLPGVDETRVACSGCSGGGTQTFLLTALDDRVKLAVPVCMVSAVFYGGCVCESGLPIHQNAVAGDAYATNNAEIAAMASYASTGPRPLHLTCIGADWTALVPVREYPFIRDVYGYYGPAARELVEYAYFPAEQHDYGPSKRQATYEFVGKHFHLPLAAHRALGGRVDETPNVIEDRATLSCFTPAHPRPADALAGHDAILVRLREVIGAGR